GSWWSPAGASSPAVWWSGAASSWADGTRPARAWPRHRGPTAAPSGAGSGSCERELRGAEGEGEQQAGALPLRDGERGDLVERGPARGRQLVHRAARQRGADHVGRVGDLREHGAVVREVGAG